MLNTQLYQVRQMQSTQPYKRVERHLWYLPQGDMRDPLKDWGLGSELAVQTEAGSVFPTEGMERAKVLRQEGAWCVQEVSWEQTQKV